VVDSSKRIANARDAFDKGDLASAIVHLDRLLAKTPDHLEGLCNAGYLRYLRGDYANAEHHLQAAVEQAPDHAASLNNLGLLRQAQGQLEQAETLYRRAAAAAPDQAIYAANLGGLLRLRGALSEATTLTQRAMATAPQNADVANAYALCRQEAADTLSATRFFARAMELAPDREAFRNNWVMSLLYEPEANSALLRESCEQSTKQPPTAADASSSSAGVLSPGIGFLSADLYQHPVGSIIARLAPVLRNRGYELFFYVNGARHDVVSRRIAATGSWNLVQGMDNVALANLIRTHRIDTLIDLSGPTGGSRGAVFARRPAQRQFTWLGFPGSSPNSHSDATLISQSLLGEQGGCYFAETLVPLEAPPFLVPELPSMPAPGPLPARSRGMINFASLHNPAKLNDVCLALWAGALRAVPASTLTIKHRSALDPAYQAHLQQRFEADGIDAGRLVFRGASTHRQMLEEYADIDIVLDSYPFSGGITTLEALWMGVPVLSLAGLRPVSRQGLAILQPAGLESWVCATPGEFAQKAQRFSADLDALEATRQSLRERVLRSALNNVDAYADALLGALQLSAAGSR
jgi:predicted O-linked N-acetylglucosamine transferase (SPINDLY family)